MCVRVCVVLCGVVWCGVVCAQLVPIRSQVSDLCCKVLCGIFEEDLVGEISLEVTICFRNPYKLTTPIHQIFPSCLQAVKLVASMVKNRKYKIRPEVIDQ